VTSAARAAEMPLASTAQPNAAKVPTVPARRKRELLILNDDVTAASLCSLVDRD
jgi:hypothetical protein